MQYAGPPVNGICPGAHEQIPSYGSNSTTALWSPSGQERLRESTPKENTGVKPQRQIKLTLFQQLLQQNWYQMYWVSFPLEHTSNDERGILTHGQPRFSISSDHACTLERILQRHLMVSTQHGKQHLPVISIYRFLEEFPNLLDFSNLITGKTIILADFNLHFDQPNSPDV